MNESIVGFYDALAPCYHLIFEDWDKSIERQGRALHSLLEQQLGSGPHRVLDCACGIGTQAISLASHGHAVTGSDLSPAAIERATREARLRGLAIPFRVSDMTSLHEFEDSSFDVVVALDNALPHLDPRAVADAVHAMQAKLRPGGLFLASIRDYDALIRERPTVQGPSFYGDEAGRRIVFQVWDWIDRETYILHMYITSRCDQRWETRHFVSRYRCLMREELSAVLGTAGFEQVRWLAPDQSGFYQPIAMARSVA